MDDDGLNEWIMMVIQGVKKSTDNDDNNGHTKKKHTRVDPDSGHSRCKLRIKSSS